MRTAITLAIDEHGKTQVVSGFDVPLIEQKQDFVAAKPKKGIVKLYFWATGAPRPKVRDFGVEPKSGTATRK